MATTRRPSFVTLGWQTWAFVVVVLTIMLASGALLMFGR